ncbi:MAG: hypothetical protein KAW17_03775 [Candidatus Eisenbacteria sp.]|nr:hypothetical protein [Candidatus Eisenbacteria bacterium]
MFRWRDLGNLAARVAGLSGQDGGEAFQSVPGGDGTLGRQTTDLRGVRGRCLGKSELTPRPSMEISIVSPDISVLLAAIAAWDVGFTLH